MTFRFLHRAGLGAIACVAVAAAMFESTAQSQESPTRPARTFGVDVASSATRTQTFMQQVPSGDATYNVWRLEFDTPEQCAAAAARAREFGVHTVSVFSKFWCFFQRKGDNDALAKIDGLRQSGLRWWEQEQLDLVPPPPPQKDLNLQAPQLRASEPIARGGLEVGGKRYTGKGVVIAVIDTGCDFRQPDFIVDGPNGKTSRFLYYWDTYSTEYDRNKRGSAPMIDFKYPNGASVGTLYTRDQLNAELRSGSMTIPDPDEDGHGTGCAGVAASNGRAIPVSGQPYGRYAGVAPEADLIGIRISNPGQGFQNAYLLGSFCEFAQKVAGDRPLVITCSFGGQYGGRDGFKIKERELSARFPLNKAGRAICFAAGNEREDGIHSRVSLSPGEVRQVSWVLDPDFAKEKNQAKFALLELYVDGLQNPGKDILFGGPKEIGHQRNGLSKTDIFEFDSEREGSFRVKNASSDPIVVDSYIYTNRNGHVRFTADTLSAQILTGSPSSAETTLTVGSYDFNNEFDFNGQKIYIPVFPYGAGAQLQSMRVGLLSSYSSPGPLRKGGNKPDFAAPGQWHIAPAVKLEKERHAREKAADKMSYFHLIDTTGQYKLFNGTSAATPYTAGVVALMFEKNKGLTFGQVKSMLQDKATRVGAGWDKEYGYGKLNLDAVTAVMNAIP